MPGQPPAAGSGALSDLRILDLSDRLGQYAGRLFASLGADVIRVEPPWGGTARVAAPFAAGRPKEEASLEFWFHNLNKRSVALDLDTAEGQDALRALARGSDVLLESSTPGAMHRRGLDYAALSALNPGLIYTSMTGFGQDGPYARWAWSDIALMALGGQMWLCGYPGAPPARLAGNQSYMQAALHGAYATMIALHHRDVTGEGQFIDVSTQDCIATAMETAMQFWDIRRELRSRTGAERNGPAVGPYPCKDGVVHWMAPATGNGWGNLVEWLRDEGVPGDYWRDEWTDPAFRQEHRDEFDEAFLPWCLRKTKQELADGSLLRHLSIGPLATIDEVLGDEQLAARDYWSEVEAPSGGARYRAPGVPVRMSETPLLAGGRAPRLGEHTDQVLAEVDRARGGKLIDEDPPAHRRALDDIRVVDFSWFGAGPMGTKVLADHGAEVIRVESQYRLDGLRRAGPQPLDREPGPNLSGYYNNHNSSKLSTQVNVNSPGGQELVRRLIATADVVIDNFNPVVMEKWRLSYTELRAIKDNLIVVNMPMMGLSGPRRDAVGFGSTLTPITGLCTLTGFENQMPIGLGTNYPDYSCNPYHAITAILAAIHYRDRSGRGQHIELSQFESTLQLIGPAILEYTANGEVPRRLGNADPQAAPHGAYRAAGPLTTAGEDDRWIAFACFQEAQWRVLVEELGSPEWATAPRFTTLADRKENEDELNTLVGQCVRTRDARGLMEALQARGVPAGVVQDAGDTLERDPQLAARAHFRRLMHPEAGCTTYDAPPVKLAKTPGELIAPAPLLGQHNEFVFKGLLGLTDQEYRSYEDQNVFD